MSYYLVSSKIQGESHDSLYTDSIELLSFDQGITQAISATTASSNSTTARAEFDPVQCAKYVDKSSPALYQACAAGTNLGDVTINFVRADGGQAITYLSVKMSNVIIAHIKTIGSNSGASAIPVDQFGLRFTSVVWQYNQQALKGGSAGNTKGAWNIAQNRPSFT